MHRSAILVMLAACGTTRTPDPVEPTAPAGSPKVTATSMYTPKPGTPPWPPLISGKIAIAPDAATIQAARADYVRLMSSWKLCIDETGAVNRVEKLQTSGFPDYDATIRRELVEWKHQPLLVDGKPTAACKAVTIVYNLPR